MKDEVSSDVLDRSRGYRPAGEWGLAKSLPACIGDYQRNINGGGCMAGIRRRWAVLRPRFWSAVSGADIPLNCQVQGGLLLSHPNGVVIHPEARTGQNCLIFQQVTIGVPAVIREGRNG